MKIGIDASILATSYESGLKNYQRNLLIGLAKIDKKNHYYIFSPKKVSIPKQKNFELVLLPGWLPIFKRQLFIPYLSHNLDIDLFHFPDVWGSIIPPCRKTIVTLQDLAPSSSYPKIFRSPKYYISMVVNNFIKKFTLKHASKIIVPSNFIKNEYITKHVNDRRLVVIGNGLSSEFKKIDKYKQKDFFLAFSDFSPRKNIDRVMSAYQLFRNINKKNIKLVVISSTNYPKAQIFTKAKRLKIENDVSVMVGVSTSTLVRLYNQSVCLIYPSLYEGFGLPILEAMVCGCPVVTTNYGATKEVAGDAAILINPYSVKSIYKGINNILSNLSLRKELVRKGTRRASNFSWEKHAKKVLELYDNFQDN